MPYGFVNVFTGPVLQCLLQMPQLLFEFWAFAVLSNGKMSSKHRNTFKTPRDVLHWTTTLSTVNRPLQ